jgi:predicted transcriptional regulator
VTDEPPVGGYLVDASSEEDAQAVMEALGTSEPQGVQQLLANTGLDEVDVLEALRHLEEKGHVRPELLGDGVVYWRAST